MTTQELTRIAPEHHSLLRCELDALLSLGADRGSVSADAVGVPFENGKRLDGRVVLVKLIGAVPREETND